MFSNSIIYLLKDVLHCNSANMSLGQLYTQIHPIALPEFPLHKQTKRLRMVSLLFYMLQNTFKKICIFLRQKKIGDRKGENIS